MMRMGIRSAPGTILTLRRYWRGRIPRLSLRAWRSTSAGDAGRSGTPRARRTRILVVLSMAQMAARALHRVLIPLSTRLWRSALMTRSAPLTVWRSRSAPLRHPTTRVKTRITMALTRTLRPHLASTSSTWELRRSGLARASTVAAPGFPSARGRVAASCADVSRMG